MLIPVLNDVLGVVEALKRLDPALWVAMNTNNGRYEVHDRANARCSMVMRVQEPSGAYRPLDGRVLQNLRTIEHFDAVFKAAEAADDARQKTWDSKTESIGAAVADEMKFAGQVVVQGVKFDVDKAATPDGGQG